MPKYEIKQEFSGKTASECYQACLRAVPLAGYRIVKRRDIASLVICEGRIEGNRVDLSMIVPMGKPTHVVLTLSSESADEVSLKEEAERVMGMMGEQLIR
ncbi:MAG: hypothetical protein ACM3S0_09585 [Acidobacteriota bacterium]